ncbi:MAG: hypothetical protein CVU56_06560 [Deltaproteobacteria bacterium HGW-Deltaproteobacteria-14]|nr:MAG: hypothetical protein CVU56_06560 [Deltaproteobacteria bacterium HGW-Deltaproteobacteria-14]
MIETPPRSAFAGLAAFCVAALTLVTACGSDPVASNDTGEEADTSVVADTVDGDVIDDTAALDTTTDTGADEDTALADTSPPADTTAPVDTVPADTVTTDTTPPPNGFPSAELVLRIVEPGGNGTAPSVGSVVRVAGILFGHADSIVWQAGEQNGAIPLGSFWQSGPIQLNPGDNTISVTASGGDRFVTDSIVVTYNPAFRFDDRLSARPSVLWVNQQTDVVFTVPTSLYGNADTSTLRLLRVDANGNMVQDVGSMKDDGGLNTSGDEIESDGVFTYRGKITCTTTEPVFFRASIQIAGTPTYTAVSPSIRVDCLSHVLTSDCNSHKTVIDGAAQDLAGGMSVDAVVADLAGQATVKTAGRAAAGGGSIWVQFNDGVLGAVLGTPAGKRGAGDNPPGGGFGALAMTSLNTLDVGSKRAVVMAPFASEFGSTDDGVDVANAIVSTECPSYELEGGTVLQGANASLARFRNLSSYGVASISTHGEALFGGISEADMRDRYQWRHKGAQEVLWTGSTVTCAQLIQAQESCTVSSANPTGGCPTGTRCLVTEGTSSGDEASGKGLCVDETQIDLRLGRAVITNKGYAVTPSFFTAHRGRGYPRSLVNLGACRSMYNGTLATALYAAGAKAITGFSGYVESAWARDKVLELFDDFGAEGQIGQRYVADEDPDNAGTWWRFFGATNLNLSNAEIINGDFETGDTVGWTISGDGRVITQLGSSTPVSGKFMGLISTGLGFTVETGTMEQTFCIPADKVQVEFYWKFFSEEFKEFCGSQYQDTFQAVLVGADGQLTLVDSRVDDLCGYEDGSCGSCSNPSPCDPECAGQSGCKLPEGGGVCTGVYNCECGRYFVGLTPSDIVFDQGGVFNVLWQHSVKNVQALAGTGPVTLRLFATDKGDSVFDTAILIDAIKFK